MILLPNQMVSVMARWPSKDSVQPEGSSGVILLETLRPGSPTAVSVRIRGLVPGSTHAIHIHERGILKGQTCKDAGGHWNPYEQQHGSRLFSGNQRHAGDLCNNFIVDERGEANFTFHDDLIDLWVSDLNPRGKSVVIHDSPDDLGLGGVFLSSDVTHPTPPVYSTKPRPGTEFFFYQDLPKRLILKLPGTGSTAQDRIRASKENGNAGGRIVCANLF